MIKLLKNQDIQVTNFAVAKEKSANNFFPDLILANDDLYSFPLLVPIEECDYNFNGTDVTGSFATVSTTSNCTRSLINDSGYLACSPVDNENNPTYQIGKKYKSDFVFYPTNSPFYVESDNPVNVDGTYMGQIYNIIKNYYYNNYNNSYNLFGFDGFDTSKAKLILESQFVSYTFNITQSGDRIRPFSVTIHNQTGDIVADIVDDGYHNLKLTGSYFINNFEIYSTNKDNVINYGETGLGKYLYESSL